MVTKKSTLMSLALLIVLLAIIATPVMAQDDPPPSGGGTGEAFSDVDSAVTEVIDTMYSMSLSGLRFMYFLSGLLVTIGVTLGVAKSSLGSALGNQFAVSNGIVSALVAVVAFAIVLVATPLTDSILRGMADKLVGSIDVTSITQTVSAAADAGSTTSSPDVSPDQVFQNTEIQGALIKLTNSVLKLIMGAGSIAVMISVAMGAFDAQLGSVMGGSMRVGSGVMRILGAVAVGIALIVALPLTNALVNTLAPRLLTGFNYTVLGF